MAEPLHPTCIETTTYDEAAADGGRTFACGPDCPRPAGPDPERDARIDIYRDRERRRAARALDRYIESLQSGETAVSAVAGEHVIELVGDYVLSRLQQKSHYGASDASCPHDCGHTDCPTHGHNRCMGDPTWELEGHAHVWQAGRCVAPGHAPRMAMEGPTGE